MILQKRPNVVQVNCDRRHPGKRDSNLELYRVVVMLAIVAHHYVVNSGLTEQMYKHPVSNSALCANGCGWMF